MSQRTSAARYAKALYDVARAESDPEVIERDLTAIVTALEEHDDLRRVLTSERTPVSARMAVVTALRERAGLQPPVFKLLALLADKGRLGLLPDLLDAYRQRRMAAANVVRATVTSAAPLSETQVQQLATRFGELTGKRVELDTAVDPTLIGGVVTRIGSTVYDGSTRTQLQKMKEQLLTTGARGALLSPAAAGNRQ